MVERRRVVGIDVVRGLVVGERRGEVAHLVVDRGAEVEGGIGAGIMFDGGSGVGERLAKSPRRLWASTGEVGPAAVGFEPNGLGEVGDGGIEFAAFVVGEAALDIGGGVVGSEADGLGEVGDGGVEVAGEVRQAAIEHRRGVGGVEAEGLGEVGDRTIVAIELGERDAAKVKRPDVPRVELQHPGEVGDGFLVLALFGPKAGAMPEGIDVIGGKPERGGEVDEWPRSRGRATRARARGRYRRGRAGG